MNKIFCNGWEWAVRESDLLHGWFEHWPDLMDSASVKKNPVRSVFTVDDRFFVKYFSPSGVFNQLRSFIIPKAAAEFKSGVALEQSGIPVVRYLGWGRKGAQSMLVSAAEPGAVTVLQQWCRQPQMRPVLLKKIADVTRLLVVKHWFHPDYHAGNLLWSDSNVCLVDVYGLRQTNNFSKKQKLRMASIIVGLRRDINDDEAHKFLADTGIAGSLTEAASIWRDALFVAGRRIMHNWPKRRRQILDGYSKFVETKDFIQLRKLEDGSIADLEKSVKAVYAPKIALDLWLLSFRLELQGIPHRRVLAIEQNNTVYFENPEVGAEVEPAKILSFINRAALLGIIIEPNTIVQLKDGKSILWLNETI